MRSLPDILSLEQLAEYLNLPKSTVYRQARSGRLPGKKVGRQWRFRKQTIDEWLAGDSGGGGPLGGPATTAD
jgi:excisionase family DNA binding protein